MNYNRQSALVNSARQASAFVTPATEAAKKRLRQLIVLGGALLTMSAKAAAPVDYSTTFVSGATQSVLLRTWAPEELPRVRGVVFSIPGSGGDSRGQAVNAALQQRLREIRFAFVGVRDLPGDYWGSEPADVAGNMEALLEGAAAALGRPEVANAPMFVYGISHGGYATSQIAQAFAPRTIGFYADKGAAPASASFGEAQANVPGMFTAASADTTVPPGIIAINFGSFGPTARTSLAIEWGLGHVNSPDFLRWAFMDEVIRKRMPAGAFPATEPNTPLALTRLPLASGWRGDANMATLTGQNDQVTPIAWPTIAPQGQYVGPEPSSWLPGEALARIYRAQNDQPPGISASSLGLSANYTTQPGVFSVGVNPVGVDYSSVELYDRHGLIAQFGPTSAAQQILYPSLEQGHATFVAVATYQHAGATHYASDFVTIDTFGPSAADYAGDFDRDRTTGADDLTVWREDFGRRDWGLAADGNRDIEVDGADLLLWQRGAGSVNSQTDGVLVPEPTGGAALGSLLLATVVAASSTRRWNSPRFDSNWRRAWLSCWTPAVRPDDNAKVLRFRLRDSLFTSWKAS